MKFRGSTKKASINYAVFSSTIVLILVGLFLLLFLHINSITNILKERINILVELNSSVDKATAIGLVKTIAKYESVLPESVVYIPKGEAYKVMDQSMKGDTAGIGNPYKDMIVYNIRSTHYSEETLKTVADKIATLAGVKEVFYENVLIDNIKANLKKISFGIFIVSIIFVVLAIIIIYNTVNLSLYADRFEIKTMEIIGARDGFIRQPYIKLAGNIAIRSFLLAATVIFSILLAAWQYLDGMKDVINWFTVGSVFLVLFLFALIITVSSTIRIVNKYLFKDVGQLYE
ncbi:MAG TPA: hypothetical protein PLZ32_12725 [Saprospiraceae bacterium]|nr:hypothetical protein [Saprospiraceae bacterium]